MTALRIVHDARDYAAIRRLIPPGFHVDHKCHSWGWHPTAHRRCVNPDHLEAISFAENMRRRDRAGAMTREIAFACVEVEDAAPAAILAPGESAADLVF